MVYEISAAIATLAFVVLVIFIIRTLLSLSRSLEKTNSLLKKIDDKIDPLTHQTSHLLQNAIKITETTNEHLEALEPVMHSISSLGETLEDFQEKVHVRSRKFSNAHPHKEKNHSNWEEAVVDIAQAVSSGILLWKNIKKGRSYHEQN